MEPLTIDQISQQFITASKLLTPEQRKLMTFESVMERLRTPVGKLSKIGKL
jgi:hypothetical protein